jgi:phosphohistidine phosphatase
MRHLILFRHGKAVPHDDAPDFERRLTARGERESAEMGRSLAADHIHPDVALVSPAARTRATWDAAKGCFETVETRYDKALYLADADRLLRLIHRIEDSALTLIIVGHNPSLHDLAIDLAGYGDRYALARLKDNFPTAADVKLEFECDHWADIAPHSARLDRFQTPKSEED